MQFFKDTNIDFIGVRKGFFIFSAIATISGIIAILGLGIDYGIDFTGGTEIAIRFDKKVETQQIRDAVAKSGVAVDEIKSFGEENQFLLRIKETGKFSEVITKSLETSIPNNPISVLKDDTIGPKIGKELRNNAFIAVFLALIAMLIYIGFRFEFVFGLGAVIALVHDVIFTFSLIVVVQHLGWINLEFNQSILAAMLTVVGFSINDTVIIFDRIRENVERHKGMNFLKLINLSINETLSRTINTVVTVVLVLIAMVILAGPVLQGFAFTMLIGILIGTYSSIYIASSFVIFWVHRVKKQSFGDDGKPTVVSKA